MDASPPNVCASFGCRQSPVDALACFLDADEDLSLLVLAGTPLRRRPFPPKPADAVPMQQCALVSRSVCDASGEPLRVEVLVEDVWVQLTDALELDVLEQCAQGEATVSELSAAFAAETGGEVAEGDLIERLRHLYSMRLISFA